MENRDARRNQGIGKSGTLNFRDAQNSECARTRVFILLIGNIIKGIVTSQAAKDLTKTALDASKNIVKTTASDVGNRLVKKVLTPKSKSIINKHTKALNKNDAVKINELVKMLNKGMGIKKI